MDDVLPQAIEVRYIIPAIRGKLASALVHEQRVSQKEAAKLLGLTESAISQYAHGKRGSEVKFSERIMGEIRTSAGIIIREKGNRRKVLSEIFRICRLTDVKQILCDIHRNKSKGLESCTICFDDKELLKIKNA